MSIPERLLRLARGYWVMAGDRIAEAEAQAEAYAELAEALRNAPPPEAATPSSATEERPVLPWPGSTSPASPRPAPAGVDPLLACYELLKVHPGADLAAVDAAYEARIAEIRPERFDPGSAQRAAAEGRRAAVEAAYEKLRDALNPTETRFERLEF